MLAKFEFGERSDDLLVVLVPFITWITRLSLAGQFRRFSQSARWLSGPDRLPLPRAGSEANNAPTIDQDQPMGHDQSAYTLCAEEKQPA